MVAAVFVAAIVYAESALQTPTYEASALVMVGQKEQSEGKIQLIPLAPSPEGLRGLTRTMARDIDSRPVAEGTIRRLGVGAALSPGELLDNLTVEQVESSQFIRLAYTDTDPKRAQMVVNTVGPVSAERISAATVFEKAGIPLAPASPKPRRNILIAFVAGLAISSAALFAVRRGWLRLGGTG